MHAGCKIIPVGGRKPRRPHHRPVGDRQDDDHLLQADDSKPVQDDFLAVMPDGRHPRTENGCFAKTFGLAEETEPAIYRAVLKPTSYLENVSQKEGTLDFFDTSYTQNGGPCSRWRTSTGRRRALHQEGGHPPDLNATRTSSGRGAADGSAGAAYFMLGRPRDERRGVEEPGVPAHPGDQPVLPLDHACRERLLQIMKANPMEVYL